MMQIKRLGVLSLSVVATLGLLVGSAQAQTASLSLTGEWFQNRGPLVDIPINGGPGLCIGGTPATGCIGQAGNPGFKPFGGGIPGSGTGMVAHNPGGPAKFTVQPNMFGQALPKSSVPVTLVNTVVQLATTFVLAGPISPGTAPATFAPAGRPPVFQEDAWSNDPGQTGGAGGARFGPNFNWCPGVGGPGCLAPGSGTVNGIVRYTGGGNAFGGTMAMLLGGTGTVSITRSLGGSVIGLAHQPVGGGPGAAQILGQGYAVTNTNMLGAAPIYLAWTIPVPCSPVPPGNPPTPPGCGVIGAQSMPAGAFPPGTNRNWGFPWTTGTVQAQNIELTALGSPGSSTLTAMGTDSRTEFGAGKITLVAGGTTNRIGAGANFAALDIVTMTFSAAAPSSSPMGQIALVLLMLLTVGFVFRHRLTGNAA